MCVDCYCGISDDAFVSGKWERPRGNTGYYTGQDTPGYRIQDTFFIFVDLLTIIYIVIYENNN